MPEQGAAVQASAATSAARRSCAVRRAASAAFSATRTSPALVRPNHLKHSLQHTLAQASGLQSLRYLKEVYLNVLSKPYIPQRC